MTVWRGQDDAIDRLRAALDGGRMHHAWLFVGPEGVGKGGIARDFAKRLLGARPGVDGALSADPGDQAAILVDAGTHPDLAMLERAAKEGRKGEAPTIARNITVDQVRGLSRFLHLAPSIAGRRVVIVDAADDLERGAANALLKNLEEPPAGTVFVLVAHAPGRLLPTIRSRCRILTFHPLDDDAMARALDTAAPSVAVADREALARIAEGSPGRALRMQALDMAAIERSLTLIADTGDRDGGEGVALARALSVKSAAPRYEAFLDLAPHFIATHARTHGAAVAASWADADLLARTAIRLSLDPASTVMSLCAAVARMAPAQRG